MRQQFSEQASFELNAAADIPRFLQNYTDRTTSVLLLFCKIPITHTQKNVDTPIYKNIANISTQHCEPDHSVCLFIFK